MTTRLPWRPAATTDPVPILAAAQRISDDLMDGLAGPRTRHATHGLRRLFAVPGLGLTDLTPDIRDQLNLTDNQRGAVVERVNPDKEASAAGIQPGRAARAGAGWTAARKGLPPSARPRSSGRSRASRRRKPMRP